MNDRAPGRWLIWGEDSASDLLSDVMASLGPTLTAAFDSAVSSSLERHEATGPGANGDSHPIGLDQYGDAAGGGEGNLSDDLDDAELIALIHERDPEWTPPGSSDSSATVSWMEVVRDATDIEVHTKVTALGARARGFLRLD